VGAVRTVIAIEDQMGAVHQALQAAVDRQARATSTSSSATIYRGRQKQLIQVLHGPRGAQAAGRPTDLGLLCQNVATATAVAAP
jgi:electron transport complex protein RnfC